MMVAAVEERHLYRGATERLRDPKAREAPADDHNLMDLVRSHRQIAPLGPRASQSAMVRMVWCADEARIARYNSPYVDSSFAWSRSTPLRRATRSSARRRARLVAEQGVDHIGSHLQAPDEDDHILSAWHALADRGRRRMGGITQQGRPPALIG